MAQMIREVGLILVVPAIVSFTLAAILWRSSNPFARQFAFAIPIASGFLTAYVLNPERLPLMPERHWQWLPYLALGTAVVGGVNFTALGRYWQIALALTVAMVMFVSAWKLVPGWDTLQPPRPVMIPLLAAYLWLIARLISSLPQRLRGRLFLFLLAWVMLATATDVAIEVSAKIGSAVVPAAAALAGSWLASLVGKYEKSEPLVSAIAAAIPVFVLLAGGSAFVGAIELPEPRYLLLLIPASPLMLWLFAGGPLARLEGTSAIIAQIVAVAIIPIAVIAWTLLKPEPVEDWSHLPFSFGKLRL
jgi:hypothetical protein